MKRGFPRSFAVGRGDLLLDIPRRSGPAPDDVLLRDFYTAAFGPQDADRDYAEL